MSDELPRHRCDNCGKYALRVTTFAKVTTLPGLLLFTEEDPKLGFSGQWCSECVASRFEAMAEREDCIDEAEEWLNRAKGLGWPQWWLIEKDGILNIVTQQAESCILSSQELELLHDPLGTLEARLRALRTHYRARAFEGTIERNKGAVAARTLATGNYYCLTCRVMRLPHWLETEVVTQITEPGTVKCNWCLTVLKKEE
jgi:hypothetical protein